MDDIDKCGGLAESVRALADVRIVPSSTPGLTEQCDLKIKHRDQPCESMFDAVTRRALAYMYRFPVYDSTTLGTAEGL